MSSVTLKGWKCDFENCGHIWYSPKQPPRCSKCKRKNWNKSGTHAPKPIHKKTKKEVKRPSVASADKIVSDSSVEDIISAESMARRWEKSIFGIPAHVDDISMIAPTYGGLSRSTPLAAITQEPSERIQKLIEEVVKPAHKVGEKCPHGWANWMQCPKCNGRKE